MPRKSHTPLAPCGQEIATWSLIMPALRAPERAQGIQHRALIPSGGNDHAGQVVHAHGFIRLEMNDRTDRLARMQEVKGRIDLIMRHVVRDIRVHVEITPQPFVDHSGQLAAPQNAAKGRSAPHTSGYQLERPCGDFFSGPGNTDDRAFAPALVTTF